VGEKFFRSKSPGKSLGEHEAEPVKQHHIMYKQGQQDKFQTSGNLFMNKL